MNCPNCNNPLVPGQKFCDACGFELPTGVELQTETTKPIEAPTEPTVVYGDPAQPNQQYSAPEQSAPEYGSGEYPPYPNQTGAPAPEYGPSEYPPYPNQTGAPAPEYGPSEYPPYQANPAQPPYQDPYNAQAQPYGGGSQPPKKKNNMPLIIVIIVLAVLLVAGGIVAAILLLNNKGDKGSDSSSSAEVTSSGVIDESSSNQDSDSSDDDSSSKRESSSRASSRYSSRESSRVDSDSNKLYNDSGVLVADDPSINVNDTTTQFLLKSVESTIASQMSQINSSAGEYLTAREYVKGNTLVMEIKFKPSVSETEKSAFLSGFNKSLSSSMPGLDSLKEKGITVAMVIAIHNSDGSLYYSKVFS